MGEHNSKNRGKKGIETSANITFRDQNHYLLRIKNVNRGGKFQ